MTNGEARLLSESDRKKKARRRGRGPYRKARTA